MELLRKVPIEGRDMRGSELKLSWLVENFYIMPSNPIELQLEQHCRSHILCLIGGELLPDKSNNRIHLIWGSACLANLYREMCRATKPNARTMGGCLILLQSWVWYRLPFIAPRVNYLPTYPFVSWWGNTTLSFLGVPRGDLTGFRSRIDHMRVNDFKWLPYETYNNNLPRQVQHDKKVWSACTTLICFSIVEWHQTDREVPESPQNIDVLHRVDKRGNQDVNWASKHVQWIEHWSHRKNQVLEGPRIQSPFHTQRYMNWYLTNSRPFISAQKQFQDPRLQNYLHLAQSSHTPQPPTH
ncbi:hypothetical protein Lal_00008117 [Lupinus albus]|nr:hypothetical protein Lal_00008117 [Lupinus albus]